MKKMIPYEKMSKKAQKEINRKKRNTWGTVKPFKRIETPATVYNRKHKHKTDSSGCPFGIFLAFV